MAASAQLLLSALSKQADLSMIDDADVTSTCSFEAPLTSEPAFADYAP